MTRQRKLIYRILCESPGHMTAEQIYSAAKEEMPGLAIGTVYRNLKLMSEAGEILHVPISSAPDIYDKTCSPHDHMICDKCGCICDLPGSNIDKILSERAGKNIESYELVAHYICDNCRKAAD